MRVCTAWPKAIHIFSSQSSPMWVKVDTAMSTTLVSLALTITLLLPFIAAPLACTNIRVSTSWCVHAARPSTESPWLLMAILSFCHNDGTACAYFADFVCKKVEPFSFVVWISQEAPPACWSLCRSCHKSPVHLSLFAPGFWFQARLSVDIKDYVDPLERRAAECYPW